MENIYNRHSVINRVYRLWIQVGDIYESWENIVGR